MRLWFPSDVALSVRPPRDIEDVNRHTPEHDPLPPATIMSLKQRRGRISERAHEVEQCNLAATLVANGRAERSDCNSKMQRAKPARTHTPIGMSTDIGCKLMTSHRIRRREVGGSNHQPEKRSQHKKRAPRHAGDYAACLRRSQLDHAPTTMTALLSS